MSSSISASLPSSSSSFTLPSEDSLSNKDIRQIVGFIRQQTAELEALKQAFENLQNTCVRYVSSDITLFGQSLRLRRKIKGTEVCVGKDRLYLSETNDIIYRGTTLEGKPHGQGVMTFPNGDRYEGAWVNGEEHGQGKLTRQDGFQYTGIWVNGKTLDTGTGTYPNGDSYKGLLIDRKESEQGTLIRKDKFEYLDYIMKLREPLNIVVDGKYKFDYEGCFKFGKMAGGNLKVTVLNDDKDIKLPKGSYIFYNITGPLDTLDTLDTLDSFKGQIIAGFANGKHYEGEWSMSKPNGQGVMTFRNGDRYEGNWVDGKRNGKGTMTSRKFGVYESHYEGYFYDGEIHGKEKLTVIYEGYFDDGEMHGKGKLTIIMETDKGEFPKGKFVYEGDFQYNKPWGEGKATYPNGDRYTGGLHFLHGRPSGQGIMEYANGDHYTGEFDHEGKPGGHGTMVYASGKRVEGQWLKGKLWH